MANYTIANKNIDASDLRKYYNAAKKANEVGFGGNSDVIVNLDVIFDIAIANREYFPGIAVGKDNNPETYIHHWVKRYYDAMKNLPSQRTATSKAACSDPAISLIVQECLQIPNQKLLEDKEKAHNLFMSAENSQGNLLEEYIARNIGEYGFYWCCGNVLKAIDFCNQDGSLLLQIKNKSNTENSSSNKVRNGTEIQKWYRLRTSTKEGKKTAAFRWNVLNDLIYEAYSQKGGSLSKCAMSEDAYRNFLKAVASKNRKLITDS